jgi:hypothetical protein
MSAFDHEPHRSGSVSEHSDVVTLWRTARVPS